MVEAFRAACQGGISSVEFWHMTPYLTGIAIGAVTDGRNTAAWINAALTRAKKMPPLEELLGKKKSKGDVGMRLKAALSGVKGKVKNG